MKLPNILFVLLISLVCAPSWAATHTWVPRAHILANGTYGYDYTLPYVSVTGNGTDYGPDDFDLGFTETAINPYPSPPNGIAIYQNKVKALSLSDVCKNPAVSQEAKSTTLETGVENRYLTATELFNSVQLANLWSAYKSALSVTVIQPLPNSQKAGAPGDGCQ